MPVLSEGYEIKVFECMYVRISTTVNHIISITFGKFTSIFQMKLRNFSTQTTSSMEKDIPMDECAILATDINRDRVCFNCDEAGTPENSTSVPPNSLPWMKKVCYSSVNGFTF